MNKWGVDTTILRLTIFYWFILKSLKRYFNFLHCTQNSPMGHGTHTTPHLHASHYWYQTNNIKKIILHSDSFLAKNQTKSKLVWEKFRLRLRIWQTAIWWTKMDLEKYRMQSISKHNLNKKWINSIIFITFVLLPL